MGWIDNNEPKRDKTWYTCVISKFTTTSAGNYILEEYNTGIQIRVIVV
jgi:hypothetical protein